MTTRRKRAMLTAHEIDTRNRSGIEARDPQRAATNRDRRRRRVHVHRGFDRLRVRIDPSYAIGRYPRERWCPFVTAPQLDEDDPDDDRRDDDADRQPGPRPQRDRLDPREAFFRLTGRCRIRSARPVHLGDRQHLPLSVDALQCVSTPVLESETGSRNELAHRPRDQRLPALRVTSLARRRHGEAPELAPDLLALAEVHARPDLDAQLPY